MKAIPVGPWPRVTRLILLAVPLLVAGAYLHTLFPGYPLWDSPELITAARQLGINHPPGNPLYLLSLHLWLYLAPAEPAWMGNLFSACCLLLALGLALALARRLRPPSATALAAPAAGALVIGAVFLSRPLWWQAARAEVYGLALCFALLSLWLGQRRLERTGSTLRFFGAGLAAGGCAAVHLAAGLALIPLLLFHATRTYLDSGGERKINRPGCWGMLTGFLLPLTAYLYFPLRSRAPLFAGWQVFDGPADTFRYLSGQSDSNRLWGDFSPAGILHNAQGLLQDYLLQNGAFYTAALWLLAALGLVVLWRQQRRAAVALSLFAAGPLLLRLLMMADRPNPDVYGYLLPASLAIALLAATGLAAIGELRGGNSLSLLLAAVFCGIQLWQGPNWNNRDNRLGQGQFETAAKALPRGAVVYLSSFHSAFLSWAEQGLAGLRPDVTFVYLGMSREKWYPTRLGFKDPQAQQLIAAWPEKLAELARQRPVLIEAGIGAERDAAALPALCPLPFYGYLALPPCPPPGGGIDFWPPAAALEQTDRVTRQHLIFQLNQLLKLLESKGLAQSAAPYRSRLVEYLPLLSQR